MTRCGNFFAFWLLFWALGVIFFQKGGQGKWQNSGYFLKWAKFPDFKVVTIFQMTKMTNLEPFGSIFQLLGIF